MGGAEPLRTSASTSRHVPCAVEVRQSIVDVHARHAAADRLVSASTRTGVASSSPRGVLLREEALTIEDVDATLDAVLELELVVLGAAVALPVAVAVGDALNVVLLVVVAEQVSIVLLVAEVAALIEAGGRLPFEVVLTVVLPLANVLALLMEVVVVLAEAAGEELVRIEAATDCKAETD